MAGELAERRGLTLEHAHGWLRHVGLLSALDHVEGEQAIIAEARSVLTGGVRRIADEIRTSIDYHTMQEGAAGVERGVLTGPAVAIPGFAEQLSAELGLELEVGIVPEARPGAFGGIDAGRLAIAAGLTVDQVAS
jgi:type IV pilus assembly protein PilM